MRRVHKLMEYNPMTTYLKNDPDLYCGIRNPVKEVDVMEICHVSGHQDGAVQTLSTVEN